MLKFNAPFSGTQVGKEAKGEPQQAGNEFENNLLAQSESLTFPKFQNFIPTEMCFVYNLISSKICEHFEVEKYKSLQKKESNCKVNQSYFKKSSNIFLTAIMKKLNAKVNQSYFKQSSIFFLKSD